MQDKEFYITYAGIIIVGEVDYGEKELYAEENGGLIRCKETACSNSKLAGKINTYVH